MTTVSNETQFTPEWVAAEVREHGGGTKIELIKRVRAVSALGLKEAKDLVELTESRGYIGSDANGPIKFRYLPTETQAAVCVTYRIRLTTGLGVEIEASVGHDVLEVVAERLHRVAREGWVQP